MIRIALSFVLAIACAPVDPPHTPASELTARVREASMNYSRCPDWRTDDGLLMTDDGLLTTPFAYCYDREGMTWSQCAWDVWGVDPETRRESDAKVYAGSCGGPGWQSCTGTASR
jgi:hypothetical protein